MSKQLNERLDKLEPKAEPDNKSSAGFKLALIYEDGVFFIFDIHTDETYYFAEVSQYREYVDSCYPDDDDELSEYRKWPRDLKVPPEERKNKVVGWDEEGNLHTEN